MSAILEFFQASGRNQRENQGRKPFRQKHKIQNIINFWKIPVRFKFIQISLRQSKVGLLSQKRCPSLKKCLHEHRTLSMSINDNCAIKNTLMNDQYKMSDTTTRIHVYHDWNYLRKKHGIKKITGQQNAEDPHQSGNWKLDSIEWKLDQCDRFFSIKTGILRLLKNAKQPVDK